MTATEVLSAYKMPGTMQPFRNIRSFFIEVFDVVFELVYLALVKVLLSLSE